MKLPENENFCEGLIESKIIDFEIVVVGTGKFGTVKVKTIKLKSLMGSYVLNQKDFEKLVIYTSNPELYLDAKKYNL